MIGITVVDSLKQELHATNEGGSAELQLFLPCDKYNTMFYK